MEFEITIKNYRCFPDSAPAKITLGEGFHALIGVNNSGKSSLLRFFYEFRTLFMLIANDNGALASALQQTGVSLQLGPSVSDSNEIFNNTNDRNIQIGLAIIRGENDQRPSGAFASKLEITISKAKKMWTANAPGSDMPPGAFRVSAPSSPGNLIIGPSGTNFAFIQNAARTLSDTLYVGPFRNTINVGANQDYYDIKVGQAFITEWQEHKTGTDIKRNEAILRLTDDIRRIFEFERLEIDASQGNTNLKVFVNNRSFKLTELGAGLTQFILVLSNAAIRKPSWIFIDEPETNLHPSLQLDFLTTLASHARQGLIFGTHSIGLARAMATRIYSLRRILEGRTEVRDFDATPNLAEFLGELGFAGYKEMGYNKLLLVEGPTDVTTFQQFLRLYGKDHKIVILPLGGRSFITSASAPQLAELTRITRRIVAIIDSERESSGAPLQPDRQAFVETCRDLGIECHVLEKRATENYLTDAAIKSLKGENFQSLGPYGELSSAQRGWNKRENWKIAREMTMADLNGTDLGQFLSAL